MASGLVGRLTRRYRVVVVDEESLNTARNWHMRPASILIIGFLGVLFVGAITLGIARATGLARQGPATPSGDEQRAMIEKMDSLKMQIEAQQALLESFRKGTGVEVAPVDSNALLHLHEGDPSDPSLFEELQEAGLGADHGQSEEPNVVENHAPAATAAPQISLSKLNLVPPVDGKISQEFGDASPGEQHFGVDIVAVENSMIRSVAEGIVIFSEYSGQTGYVIGIFHPRYNLVSFYKHNSKVFKTTGSYVFAGEAIAVIGQSGRNQTGPHLHFELWHNGKPINPQEFIFF